MFWSPGKYPKSRSSSFSARARNSAGAFSPCSDLTLISPSYDEFLIQHFSCDLFASRNEHTGEDPLKAFATLKMVSEEIYIGAGFFSHGNGYRATGGCTRLESQQLYGRRLASD